MLRMLAICPDHAKQAAAQWVQSKGWGDSAGELPLSPTGLGPATHWCGVSLIGENALAILESPRPSPEDAALLKVVQVRVRDTQDPLAFVAEVLAELGLQFMQEDGGDVAG